MCRMVTRRLPRPMATWPDHRKVVIAAGDARPQVHWLHAHPLRPWPYSSRQPGQGMLPVPADHRLFSVACGGQRAGHFEPTTFEFHYVSWRVTGQLETVMAAEVVKALSVDELLRRGGSEQKVLVGELT